MTYTLDKLPYHALAQYMQSSDVKSLTFAQIDSIFDPFMQSLVDDSHVHKVGVQLLLYSGDVMI